MGHDYDQTPMPLEAMMLARDKQVTRVLQSTLDKLSISVEVCDEAKPCLELLTNQKYDAVIVDCDDLPGGLDVLQMLRKSASNRSSIAFAILNGVTNTHKAFEMGANFVLQKPVSALNAMRCFSAGLGLMVREQRRYFRHAVELEVTLTLEKGEQVQSTTTNISEGGMAFRASVALPRGGIVKALFTLPGTPGEIEVKGEVMWANSSGLCGLRFTEIAKPSRERLEQWLLSEMGKGRGRAAKTDLRQ